MRENKLHFIARLALFSVSYSPLFFIMCFTQLYNYRNYLNWGGFTLKAITTYGKYFGVASLLLIISFISIIGVYIFLKNIDSRTNISGRPTKIIDIENKNSEALSYLFTYVIPFVFHDLSSIPNIVAISVLLIVSASIYINSSMIIINPILNIKYTIYKATFIDIESSNRRNGMLLSKLRYLEESDVIYIENVGSKLFYAK